MTKTRSILLLLSSLLILSSCATTMDDPMTQQQIANRNAAISMEPRGNWFIGRRFYIERTQFWGYIRRPGQSWDNSQLVMINENQKLQPDRLPEAPSAGANGHGFDHNHEYRMYGHFSGQTVYDPNSDLFLPEFVLTNYERVTASPGWLFHPKEKFDGKHLLRAEPQNTRN